MCVCVRACVACVGERERERERERKKERERERGSKELLYHFGVQLNSSILDTFENQQ